MPKSSHYDVLQVSQSADQKVVTAAYRALAKLYHPDSPDSDFATAERMQRINEAYEILSDPTRRADYDRAISATTADQNATTRQSPPSPPPPDSVVVGDGADFATIGEAVASASAGSTIRLRSGRYCEAVTLRSDLTLIGDEDGGVIWTTDDQVCLVVDGAAVDLAAITFEAEVTEAESDQPPVTTCIEVQGGSVALRNCKITADRGICAHSSGEGDPTRSSLLACEVADCRWGAVCLSGSLLELVETRITGCAISGVCVIGEGRAGLSDCRLEDNALACAATSGGALSVDKTSFERNGAAVWLSEAGTARLSDCRVVASAENGVDRQADGGELTIERSEFLENSSFGVSLKGPAGATVCHARFSENAEHGLFASTSRNLRVEDCVAEQNGKCGFAFTHNASFILHRCTTVRNGSNGIYLQESQGSIAECLIADNGDDGLEVRNTECVSVVTSEFRVEDSDEQAIGVYGSKAVTIESCRFGPVRSVVVGTKGSAVVVRNSEFFDYGYGMALWEQSTADVAGARMTSGSDDGYGFWVDEASALTLARSEMKGGFRGIQTQARSRADIADCVISGCSNNGLHVVDHSTLDARNCRLFENGDCGAFFKAAGGSLRSCASYRNRGFGVALAEASDPSVQQCRLVQNASLGVAVSLAGSARIEGCDLTGNGEGPWSAHGHHQVTYRGNRTAQELDPYDEDPYLPGAHHRRQHEETYFGTLAESLDAFQAFARQHLRDWQHLDTRHGPDGRSLSITYSRRLSQPHMVKAATARARLHEGLRAGSGGAIRTQCSIGYDLWCEVAIEQVEDWMTRVALTVEEHIDRDGNAGRQLGSGWTRPFERDFVAPSQLHILGYFGLELQPFMAGQMTPPKS